MKTYICPNYLKDSLLANLLKDEPSIFGIEIISINQFLQDIYPDAALNTYAIYQHLTALPLTDLKGSLKDGAFLKGCLKDRYLCDMYGIKPNDLALHPDYQLILNALPSLNRELLTEKLKDDFSNYTIVEAYYPLFVQEQIIDIMIKNGAQTLTFKACEDHQDYQIPTQNYRQGIDKIATYIINEDLDITDCAVIASSDQYDLIKTNFKRFHIPVYTNSASTLSRLGQKLVAIIDFYLAQQLDEKTQRNAFKKLVTINALSLLNNDSLDICQFIDEHLAHFALTPCHQFDGLEANRANDYYLTLQANYNLVLEPYIALYQELNQLSSFNEVILKVFDILKDNSKATLKIKQIIENYRDDLEAAYPFYREELMHIKTSETKSGLLLLNFNEEIFNKPYLFVLNPNTKNYPGFKGRDGFLNEPILEKTTYPGIEERYNHHALAHNYLKKSHKTFYLLPGSSIDGKANEFDESIKKYPTHEVATADNPDTVIVEHHLNSDSAQKAFFKEHCLYGSVSSFEKYRKCPYSYFLNYGLDLYVDHGDARDAAAAGTIIHKVFEELGKQFHKDYYLASEADIDHILNQYQERYALTLPTHPELNAIMLKRIKKTIMNELIFIKSMEEATDYIPTAFEYPFRKTIVKDGLDEIVLKGVIDRVDELGNSFRVIDYKTSEHDLKEDDIKQGLQLQLLTYALLYQDLTHKKPLGQFYLNVNQPKNKIVHYSYAKTKGIVEELIDENQIIATYHKAHRLCGMVYDVDEGLDKDGNHIKNNRGVIKTIDLELTRQYINDIYLYLLNEIRNGNIDLRPVEGACQYCEYHTICHFKGLELKKLEQPIEGSLKKEDA